MGGPAAGFPELGAAGAFAAPPPMPMPPPPMPEPMPVQVSQPPPLPPPPMPPPGVSEMQMSLPGGADRLRLGYDPGVPMGPANPNFNPHYAVFHDSAGRVAGRPPYNALVRQNGSVVYNNPAGPYSGPAKHAFQTNPDSIGIGQETPLHQVGNKPSRPEVLAELQTQFDAARAQHPDIVGVGHGQANSLYKAGQFPHDPTKADKAIKEGLGWSQDLTGPMLQHTPQQVAQLAREGFPPPSGQFLTANAAPPSMPARSVVASNTVPPPGVPPAPTYTPQPGGVLEGYTQGQPPPVPDGGPRVGSPENPYSRPWATGGNIGQPPLAPSVPSRAAEMPEVASAAAAKGVEIGYGPPPAPALPGSPPVAAVPQPYAPTRTSQFSSSPPATRPPQVSQSPLPSSGRGSEPSTNVARAAPSTREIGSDYAANQGERLPWKPAPEGTPAKIAAANEKSWTKALGKGLETAGKAIEKAKANGPKPIAVDPPRPQTAFLGAPLPRNVDMFGRPRHYKA